MHRDVVGDPLENPVIEIDYTRSGFAGCKNLIFEEN